jgi:hypothetical protein
MAVGWCSSCGKVIGMESIADQEDPKPCTGERVDVYLCPERCVSVEVTPDKILGSGRSATARLVCVDGLGEDPQLVVEKVFCPGWLTRCIYFLAFQAPFGYRFNQAAIITAFYRRRVVRSLVTYFELPIEVSNALYYRWSAKDQAFVLGTEYVPGRGLQVDPVNDRMLRSLLRRRTDSQPDTDCSQLLPDMRRLERRLQKCGLVGSGWQTSPAALVSTANFIKRDDRFWLIDIESGIPAIVVPYYIVFGLCHGRFPMFDDVVEGRWQRWLETNAAELEGHLGDVKFKALQADSEAMCRYSASWRNGELALFRNPLRILSAKARAAMRATALDQWRRQDLIDGEEFEWYQNSSRYVLTRTFLCGVGPGRIGRFFRKLSGNQTYRQSVGRFMRDRQYRQDQIAAYTAAKAEQWRADRRIADSAMFSTISVGFLRNWLLSRTASVRLHRFLVDREVRREMLRATWLFFVSERFQTEYARFYVFRSLKEWVEDGRLPAAEEEIIRSRVSDGSMQEYIRCFAFHATIKLASPLTTGLKIIGFTILVAAFAGAGTEADSYLAVIPSPLRIPLGILFIVNTSVMRTLVTLSRMISIKRRHISYGIALLVGMIPTAGSLAYPLQMYWSCRELSVFLMRHILARVGQALPIYGGKHTRTEVWMVRLANIPVESFELAKSAASALHREEPGKQVSESAPQPVAEGEAALIQRLFSRFEVSD